MAPEITFPTYSFVQLQEDEYKLPDCNDVDRLCLPITSYDNLRFQCTISGLTELEGDQERVIFFVPLAVDAECSEDEVDPELETTEQFEAANIFAYDTAVIDGLGENEIFLFITGEGDGAAGRELENGQCFKIGVFEAVIHHNERPVISAIGCTNCFKWGEDDCDISKISYYSGEDSMGFTYLDENGDAITGLVNMVELPMYTSDMQFQEQERSYEKSNMAKVKLMHRLSEQWTLNIGYMPNEWHTKLKIALSHDFVNIYSDESYLPPNNVTSFITEGDYEMERVRGYRKYPYSMATQKLISAAAINMKNHNCQ